MRAADPESGFPEKERIHKTVIKNQSGKLIKKPSGLTFQHTRLI